MASKQVALKVELERETDLEFSEWADAEGRSKRRHVAIVMRKLAHLRRTKPAELERLGLLDGAALALAN